MIQIASLQDYHLPILQRCYDRFPCSVPLEELSSQMEKDQAVLYEQWDGILLYVGIFQVCPKGLHLVVGASNPKIFLKPEAWKEQLDFLLFCAKYYDKETIRLTGRRSWRKHLLPLGFEEIRDLIASNGRILTVFERDCDEYS